MKPSVLGWKDGKPLGGVQFDYFNDLQRQEEPLNTFDPVMREQFINKEIGGFLSGRWYKNTSLRQQWGLNGDMLLSYPLDENEVTTLNTKRRFLFSAGVTGSGM